MHQHHLSLCFPLRGRDRLSSWGLQSEFMQTAGQYCLIRLPSQRSPPLALHAEQPPGDPWPLASHGVLILPSASGSTAVAAEGGVLGPQLGSRVPAGPSRQLSSGEPGPDTDVAVQQLKGRAAGGATFEAMPISGLKMYGTLVKLSSFHGAMATDLGLAAWLAVEKWRVTFVLPVLLLLAHMHTHNSHFSDYWLSQLPKTGTKWQWLKE